MNTRVTTHTSASNHARGFNPASVRAGIESAMLHRMDPAGPLDDNGRQFVGMSMTEMGRQLLTAHGVESRGLGKAELASRMMAVRDASAMHTGSDFANILANVANKRLRMAYEENPGTFRFWARRGQDAQDFKTISAVQMSAMPDLLQVTEAGEIRYGSISDGAEKYSLLTYGRVVNISRQAIINDDLRAFDRILTGFGAAAARLENRTVYAQLTGNANLSDGQQLFSAAHANNGTGAGSALQLTALTAGRAAMRVQKGLQSEELNLAPAFLLAPAALEQTAYQLTSANYVPAMLTNINEFRAGGRTSLQPIIEPVLDGVSAATWYLAANTSQVDTIEYCYLAGHDAPFLEVKAGFEQDGVAFKCRHDFAAKALDYRGLYRGVGS